MNLKHLYFVIIISLVFGCKNERNQDINISSKDYHALVDKLTEVMVHDIFSPPVASRLYVYPNIASYEILSQNNEKFNSLNGQINDLNTFTLPKAEESVNLELAALIGYLDVAKELVFSKEKITSYRDSLYSIWENKNVQLFTDSKSYALKASSQIINWMNTDNYIETRTMPDYNIYTNDPSRWEPTPPAYMKGIEPHWDKIRTMALDSAAQYKPKKHPDFSLEKGTQFYNELMEVYQANLDIRKKGDNSVEIAIARFWDSNPFVSVNKGHFMFAEKKITPGAHWIGICKIASIENNYDFENTVFAYTKTSIAIFDAFISCWDEKYRSNLIRPETIINKYIDDTWVPILQTPPFPEYTSGHSVVSGAASEVLTSIFGDNFYFEDTTELPYGLPTRPYTSFRAAAQEAAISRLYGGIHYNAAIKEGLSQGIKVGTLVNSSINFLK